jgi:hypothetical protein
MVVNGTHKFVGSDRHIAQAAIARALQQSADMAVQLTIQTPVAPDRIVVGWQVSAAPAGAQLHLALVQRGIVRQIEAGENAGTRLQHDNVVRAFTTIDLSQAEALTVALPVPQDVVRQQASVIGYVQHIKTMRMLGAARVDLH